MFFSPTRTFISQELIDKMAEANVLAMRLGPGKHLHDRKILGGDVMDGREFDYFHDMIIGQELVRPAARGFQVTIRISNIHLHES
jgi:hypothetical protein